MRISDWSSDVCSSDLIKIFAPNSAEARKAWIEDPAVDAWIIWNIWQLENADIADAVAIEPDVLIYRSMAIAPVATSLKSSEVQRFATWLDRKSTRLNSSH